MAGTDSARNTRSAKISLRANSQASQRSIKRKRDQSVEKAVDTETSRRRRLNHSRAAPQPQREQPQRVDPEPDTASSVIVGARSGPATRRREQRSRGTGLWSNLLPNSINNGPQSEQERTLRSQVQQDEIATVKRRRTPDSEQEPIYYAKCLKQHPATSVQLDPTPDDNSLVLDWLQDSCSSRQYPDTDITHNLQDPGRRPRHAQFNIPSARTSFAASDSESRASERITASVHDLDYQDALALRNIYIERDDPPQTLMRQAHRLISRERSSPEMDEADHRQFLHMYRKHQHDAEDVITQKLLTPFVIPDLRDDRLDMNSNQSWFNSVAVPLQEQLMVPPLPLPKPKPDLAFGYSHDAFNSRQLDTIQLLVKDRYGRSYAYPDKKLRFPFLVIEYKSAAKNGTHPIARYQAAGAGAIATRGHLELLRRIHGEDSYDYDDVQFFSITVDQYLACINVHWVKAPSEGDKHSFHVEGLCEHLLKDPEGLKKVVRAIKNILDYGGDQRLRGLCNALDTYQDAVVGDRQLTNAKDEERQLSGLTEHTCNQFAGGLATVAASNEPRPQLSEAAPCVGSKPVPSPNIPARRTRSCSKAPCVQVDIHRKHVKSQPGWSFRLRDEHCFVADNKWRKFVRDGRAALRNSDYGVWSYAD